MHECIVRMKMPTKDKACGMVFDFDGIWYCPVAQRICHQPDNGDIPSWCPIVCQLPEGHGELIERSKLFDWYTGQRTKYPVKQDSPQFDTRMMYEIFGEIDDAPTIVPAEAESPSPKPTDPLPIRGVEYVPTEVDVQTGTVTYELRERSET